MNTVGPYHNRQETYNYFSLPFCKGPQSEIGHYHETLGEALQGVELEFSGLEIGFKGGWVQHMIVYVFSLLTSPCHSFKGNSLTMCFGMQYYHLGIGNSNGILCQLWCIQ